MEKNRWYGHFQLIKKYEILSNRVELQNEPFYKGPN